MNVHVQFTVSGDESDSGNVAKALQALADALTEAEQKPPRRPVGFVVEPTPDQSAKPKRQRRSP